MDRDKHNLAAQLQPRIYKCMPHLRFSPPLQLQALIFLLLPQLRGATERGEGIMAKVHPDAAVVALPAAAGRAQLPGAGADEGPVATVLTVWRKSLLFNCDGFTVFDAATGDLAFRVDCYGGGRRRHRRLRAQDDVVLMGPAGAPLLTVRRKRLSLAEHWVIYDGDGTAEPLLSVRRCHVGFRHAHASSPPSSSSKQQQQINALAHVTPLSSAAPREAYVVEGSYARRSVAVRGAAAGLVAEVRRKESPVGDEVFRLVVPDPSRLGATLAMGIVIALDEMFGGPGDGAGASARSLLPRSWSL